MTECGGEKCGGSCANVYCPQKPCRHCGQARTAGLSSVLCLECARGEAERELERYEALAAYYENELEFLRGLEPRG